MPILMTRTYKIGGSIAVILPAPWCRRHGITPGSEVEVVFLDGGGVFTRLLDHVSIYPADPSAEPSEPYGIRPGPGRRHPDDEEADRDG